MLKDVLDLRYELRTLHRTMYVEASARVMCFADAVGAHVVAKYHSRRRDTVNHVSNAGNATLIFHVVFTRILHTRSEAVWQTPPTDERWINRRKIETSTKNHPPCTADTSVL